MPIKKLLLLSSLVLSALTVNASTLFDDDEPIPIIIVENGESDGGKPLRSTPYIPFECYYYPSMSSIEVLFLTDLGSVCFTITNMGTNEHTETIIDAEEGLHSFPVPCSPGSYEISFSLADETVFTGFLYIEL